MQEKIKNLLSTYEHELKNLRDIRVAGLLVFVVVVLLISWSGVKTIETNYVLQKQISQLQQENNVQELSNSNQKLQNEYFKTDTYLELQARQSFGLAKPGETLILVPEKVANNYLTKLPAVAPSKASTASKPTYQQNFEAWMDFILHRNDDAI